MVSCKNNPEVIKLVIWSQYLFSERKKYIKVSEIIQKIVPHLMQSEILTYRRCRDL